MMTTAIPGGTSTEFPTTLKVAVVQYDPVKDTPDATEENLHKMTDLVEQAHGAGAKLVLFPELGTCGYKIGDQSVEDAIQAAPAVTKTLGDLARTYGLRIVASYPSRGEDGLNYITASVFDPKGNVELTYDKTHPWAASDFENKHFALGSSFQPSVPLLSFPHIPDPNDRAPSPLPSSHQFDDTWLNVLICWDLEFPEPARCVRLSTPGDHHSSPLVLCVPTANADADVATFTLRSRAAENHLFLLCANNAGPDFCGDSCVIGPDGKVLAKAEGVAQQIIYAELDLGKDAYATKKAANPLLEWRRPEMYGVLGEAERWEKPSQRPGGF